MGGLIVHVVVAYLVALAWVIVTTDIVIVWEEIEIGHSRPLGFFGSSLSSSPKLLLGNWKLHFLRSTFVDEMVYLR